jgi:26S proteasome regulatory subunit T2
VCVCWLVFVSCFSCLCLSLLQCVQGQEKKKYQPPPQPPTIGRKKKRRDRETTNKIPTVTPHSRCRLRKLKLERIKDYLLMEQEFVSNQEHLKPQESKNEEERAKVEEIRGTPMAIGSLEEIVDDRHAIVSSSGRWFFLWGGGFFL